MTEREPRPVGDPVTAYRRVLARAHRAEATVRELRARIAEEQQEDQ